MKMGFEIIKKWKGFIIAIVLIILIKIVALNPLWVEQYYSTGLYPIISKMQRIIFGWMPFSVGDLFYIIAIILLIKTVFKIFKHHRFTVKSFTLLLKKMGLLLLWVYVVFNILWGLNY